MAAKRYVYAPCQQISLGAAVRLQIPDIAPISRQCAAINRHAFLKHTWKKIGCKIKNLPVRNHFHGARGQNINACICKLARRLRKRRFLNKPRHMSVAVCDHEAIFTRIADARRNDCYVSTARCMLIHRLAQREIAQRVAADYKQIFPDLTGRVFDASRRTERLRFLTK